MSAAAPPPSYLVALFLGTAGNNEENFGGDEAEIIIFSTLIYDVANNKILAERSWHVRPNPKLLMPNAETQNVDADAFLSDECYAQTQVDRRLIRTAPHLDQVLTQIDGFLESNGLQLDDSGSDRWSFISDGQVHMRLILHPECAAKKMSLRSHYCRSYDLRKEFRKRFLLPAEAVESIQSMLKHCNSTSNTTNPTYGARQCQDMATIIKRMLDDNHSFGRPELIKISFETGVCQANEYVDDETVVRARGLPWQSTDTDVARFFQGLNIAKGGVALCLSSAGRRNGEALVRFECKEHRDLALRRHKHHLSARYIEVYRASGRDFVAIAGGSHIEAHEFLSRPGRAIIRMRGLPYTATAQQVVEFFLTGPVQLNVLDGARGVLFVRQGDGRATGDAFVMFSSECEGEDALKKHREVMGTRYIELFMSTTAEVQQILNRSLELKADTAPEQTLVFTTQLPRATLPLLSLTAPPPAKPMPTPKTCVKITGLPIDATVSDILTFLGEHSRNIIFQGVHMVLNSQGAPCGEAYVQMETVLAAESCALTRQGKYALIRDKKFTLAVVQCSPDEIQNLVAAAGASSPMRNPPALLPHAALNPMIAGQALDATAFFSSAAAAAPAQAATLMTAGSPTSALQSLQWLPAASLAHAAAPGMPPPQFTPQVPPPQAQSPMQVSIPTSGTAHSVSLSHDVSRMNSMDTSTTTPMVDGLACSSFPSGGATEFQYVSVCPSDLHIQSQGLQSAQAATPQFVYYYPSQAITTNPSQALCYGMAAGGDVSSPQYTPQAFQYQTGATGIPGTAIGANSQQTNLANAAALGAANSAAAYQMNLNLQYSMSANGQLSANPIMGMGNGASMMSTAAAAAIEQQKSIGPPKAVGIA